MDNATIHKEKVKKKFEFSKLLLLQESVLIWIETLAILGLAYIAVINERYNHVLDLLKSKNELLEYIAKRLLEIETMDAKEFNEIIKGQSHCEELINEVKEVQRFDDDK